ncbi:hypothetical protein K438DRAFT_871257 [Mycena galopus ATCC 62051]|nr:hypothetical protein K438DRAFT_871257 [Mycena galopus ATCC 62051]
MLKTTQKTHPLKGRARHATFLDEGFRRVREALDGEWKWAIRALKGAIFASENQMAEPLLVLARTPTDPQPLPRLPPMLAQYAKEEHDKNGEGGPTTPPFSRSISDPLPLPSSSHINTQRRPLGTRGSTESLPSVTSLPLLGMIRGVPVGNRIPLRVTNPGDHMSMSSSSGSLTEIPNPKPMKSSPLCDGIALNVPSLDTAPGQCAIDADRAHHVG